MRDVEACGNQCRTLQANRGDWVPKSLIKHRLATTLLSAGLILSWSAAGSRDALAAADFAAWLAEFKQAAMADGITQQTLDSALSGVQPIARVIELDRFQPEGRVS